MAFLDNSGDIIMDAVLTDEGRKKMANGTFRITKFAMGDDEIDYGLYQKDHNLLLSTALATADKFLVSDATDGPAILFETGLDTTIIAGDATNKSTYLVSNNLVDSSFYVSFDNRFIVRCLGGQAQQFDNTSGGGGTPTLSYTLVRGTSVNTDLQLDNYSTSRIRAGNDGVVYDGSYAVVDTTVSAIEGPRASFGVLGFVIKANLDSEFTLYGAVSQDVFGDGKLYSYIDTTVYVKGTKTGCQIQIPLRIIKYISG